MILKGNYQYFFGILRSSATHWSEDVAPILQILSFLLCCICSLSFPYPYSISTERSLIYGRFLFVAPRGRKRRSSLSAAACRVPSWYSSKTPPRGSWVRLSARRTGRHCRRQPRSRRRRRLRTRQLHQLRLSQPSRRSPLRLLRLPWRLCLLLRLPWRPCRPRPCSTVCITAILRCLLTTRENG